MVHYQRDPKGQSMSIGNFVINHQQTPKKTCKKSHKLHRLGNPPDLRHLERCITGSPNRTGRSLLGAQWLGGLQAGDWGTWQPSTSGFMGRSGNVITSSPLLMCAYVYICLYVYIHIYIYTYVYIHIYICLYTYTHMYTYILYTYVFIYICIYIHMYLYTYV